MLKQRQQLFATLLVAADAAVVAAAAYGAWAVRVLGRGEEWPLSWEGFFKEPLVLFIVPIAVYAMRAFGLYRPRRDRSLVGEIGQVGKASAVSLVVVVVVLWAVGNEVVTMSERALGAAPVAPLARFDSPRLQMGALAVLLPVMLVMHRVAFRLGVRHLRSRGWNLRHVLVIGTGRLGQIAARTLGRNSWTGLEVAYFVSHHDQTRRDQCLGRPVRGGLADLERTLEQHEVDAVYIAIPGSKAARMAEILRRLERFALDVRIVPDVHPRYLPSAMTVSELEGMPILSYRESPVYGVGGVQKRALDILGAVVALAMFAVPMALIAVAIRLTSPGKAIFKQRRVGLNGEVFKIYKFRTMYAVAGKRDSHAEPVWTRRDDPRVTPIGRFLRRSSLDELPQLFNVLSGRMSLVGPRPERPELIERFRDDWRGYMLRQHVKAGMTGWAQVNGLRGDTSLRKRLQYDLFYVRHWSIWFDVRILFMTIFRGFVHRNAH